jgi:hypothetical protein
MDLKHSTHHFEVHKRSSTNDELNPRKENVFTWSTWSTIYQTVDSIASGLCPELSINMALSLACRVNRVLIFRVIMGCESLLQSNVMCNLEWTMRIIQTPVSEHQYVSPSVSVNPGCVDIQSPSSTLLTTCDSRDPEAPRCRAPAVHCSPHGIHVFRTSHDGILTWACVQWQCISSHLNECLTATRAAG